MAIEKMIPLHSSQGIANVRKYIEDQEKTDIGQHSNRAQKDKEENIAQVLEYDINAQKTTLDTSGERLVLVSGYHCTPECAEINFAHTREMYEQTHPSRQYKTKKPVIAYHVIQSFPPDIAADPRIIHKIGMEFVQGLKDIGLGDYQAVVSTHMNTAHLHNHILLNAYDVAGRQKFKECKDTHRKLRELNDQISIKYGLPVMPDRMQMGRNQPMSAEKTHGKNGETWARDEGRSWKEQFRTDITEAMQHVGSFAEWQQVMERTGYSFRILADGTPYSITDGKHRVRLARLGEPFTFESIVKSIAEQHNMSISEENHIAAAARKPAYIPIEYVSRYTADGIKKSLLVYMIEKIVARLKQIIEICRTMGDVKTQTDCESQIKELSNVMDKMQKIGLNSSAEILVERKRLGYDMYSIKQHIASLDKSISRIQTAISKSNGTTQPISVLSPMTQAQRQELYLAVKNSGYHVRFKFDMIDAVTAQTAINFLKSDRKGEMPDILAESGRNKREKNKMMPFDANPRVSRETDDKGHTITKIDTAGLSQKAQAQIQNSFGELVSLYQRRYAGKNRYNTPYSESENKDLDRQISARKRSLAEMLFRAESEAQRADSVAADKKTVSGKELIQYLNDLDRMRQDALKTQEQLNDRYKDVMYLVKASQDIHEQYDEMQEQKKADRSQESAYREEKEQEQQDQSQDQERKEKKEKKRSLDIQ